MRKLTTTDSSNVVSVSHSSGVDGEYIDVEFKSGGLYRYADVTSRMFLEACAAESLGKWVNENLVRHPDKSKFTKLRGPQAIHGAADGVPSDFTCASPDWALRMTADEAERQFKNFKFAGIGWYLDDTDTMLVVPVPNTPTAGVHYDFRVWNSPSLRRGPISFFRWAADAPVVHDSRSKK